MSEISHISFQILNLSEDIKYLVSKYYNNKVELEYLFQTVRNGYNMLDSYLDIIKAIQDINISTDNITDDVVKK